MKEVCWGIIGCGDVTEVKSGPAFQKVPHSRLVAVMRRNALAAEDYAKRHGVQKWYTDAASLINDPEVNAVYIATPPGSHAELAQLVSDAGKPCYVEKPMARNAQECQQMIAAFETHNLPLFIAYYRRALPHFKRVAEIIHSGELGELRQLTYDFSSSALLKPEDVIGWRYQPEISGGGLFWDLGSHVLDLLDFWLGPLNQASGHCLNISGNSPVEELVSMTALSESNVPIAATWNFISTESTDQVCLRFSKGVIRCSIFDSSSLEIEAIDKAPYTESFDLPENIQYPLILNIVESLRTGSPAVSTGLSASRTNGVIDAVAAGAQ